MNSPHLGPALHAAAAVLLALYLRWNIRSGRWDWSAGMPPLFMWLVLAAFATLTVPLIALIELGLALNRFLGPAPPAAGKPEPLPEDPDVA